MFGDSVFQYVDEEELPPDDTSPFNDRYERVTEAVEAAAPPQPLQVVPPAATPLPPSPSTSVPFTPTSVRHSEIFGSAPPSVASPLSFVPQPPTFGSPRSPSIAPAQQRESSTPGQQREKTVRFVSTPSPPSQNGSPTTTSPALKRTTSMVHPSALAPRRSSRTRNAPKRLGFDGTGQGGYLVMNVDCLSCAEPVAFNAVACNDTDPFALKAARGSDPDTLSWDEAMGAPDREQWIAAALSEVRVLEKNETWVEVPVADAKTKILRALGSSAARELLMASSRSIKVVIAAAVTSKKASSTRQPTLCFGRRSVFFSFFHSPGVGLHAQLTLRVPLFRPSSKIGVDSCAAWFSFDFAWKNLPPPPQEFVRPPNRSSLVVATFAEGPSQVGVRIQCY